MKMRAIIAVVSLLTLTGCAATPTADSATPERTMAPTPIATSTPPPEPPATEAAPLPHVISDAARHVLDTNLGAGFTTSPAIKDQYCTMSDTMLASAASIAVETWRDITEADFVTYVEEACGR